MGRVIFLATLILCLSQISLARKGAKDPCRPVSEANNYLGTERCISGTVTRVEQGEKGATFLSFCSNSKTCPFNAVVFSGDLKKMGDLRLLEGRQVEITGVIQQYEGRAEIVVKHTQQLGDSAYVTIPRVPTEYDLEKAGHGRAGSIKKSKTRKPKIKKQGDSISIEDPNEPQ